jgi:hypothetical protein
MAQFTLTEKSLNHVAELSSKRSTTNKNIEQGTLAGPKKMSLDFSAKMTE